MTTCRNCKKIIMYAVNGYCEECITPARLKRSIYRPYLTRIIGRAARMKYTLTMLEIRQTARTQYDHDHNTRYGW